MAGCASGRSGGRSYATPPDPPPIPPPKPLAKAPTLAPTRTLDEIAARLTGLGLPKPKAKPERGAPAVQSAPQVQAKAPAPASKSHLVTRGQSVYSIARQYDVTVRDVIAANELAPPYMLAVGQRLVVPQAGVQQAGIQQAAVQQAAPPRPKVHVVKKGDTVYGIARRYGADLKTFMKLNGIAAPYRIQPGQKLALPAGSGGETAVAGLSGAGAGKLTNAAATTSDAAARRAVPPPEVTGPIPKPAPRAGDKFLWPVDGELLLTYGPKKGGLHNDGINIAAPRGTPVMAAENGVVAYAGNELRGFGNLLLIKHDGGWMTAYAHNDEILVGRGARVRRGQPVARVGDSGNVMSPQLHFEIRKGTRAVNPAKLLGPSQSAQNM